MATWSPTTTCLASRCPVTGSADVSDAAAVGRAIDRAEADLGAIDVLVNCAGFAQEIELHEITDADWRRMLAVHLGGTFHTCRLLGPRMRDRGRGAIVNLSSELALAGSDVMAHYCAAKGAIIGLTKALALRSWRRPCGSIRWRRGRPTRRS